MAAPLISAIICTHNRDQYLGAAIDSLLTQSLDNYEVIVVNNASTDNTAEVAKARLNNPKVRYIHEEKLGLSVARNTGAEAAKADIVAYLDDDAEASEVWLAELMAEFEQQEKVAIAGGKVTLIWQPNATPPSWLSEELSGSLGAYDLVDELVTFSAGLALGAEGHPSLGAMGIAALAAAPRFDLEALARSGRDTLATWRPRRTA